MRVFAEAQTLALASFTLFPTHKVATTSSQDEDTGLRGNQGEVDEMKHEVKGGRPLQGPSTSPTKKFLAHFSLVQALALSVVSGHDKPPLAHLVRKNVRAIQHRDYIGPRGLYTYQRLLRTTLA